MTFNIGMLQAFLPASVYDVLVNNPKETHISDKDWHKARCYMLNLTDSGAAKLWKIIAVRDLTSEERCEILRCEVLETEFGYSMKFYCRDKKVACIPIASCSALSNGQEFKSSDLQIATFHNEGMPDIYRVGLKGEFPTIMDSSEEWETWTKKVWNETLNPIRHAQWDREGSHHCNKMFRDLVLY